VVQRVLGHAIAAAMTMDLYGLAARAPPRCQRAGGRALRALRPPCRFAFAPGFLLGPGPLVAALPVQHQVGFGHAAAMNSASRVRSDSNPRHGK
jgi:hypothetical protein